ncbi:LAP2 [Candida margitis]|uniref:LAP2 n=1 Tax=Candida margitis TaxID=1775924 RepID=UPI002227B89F|nr:LAP2 [Candida margitis]KAI5968700.1 LAP2 [Candida margitis]
MSFMDKLNISKCRGLDPSTQSNYSDFKVNDTTLDLAVSFENRAIEGVVLYNLFNKTGTDQLVLDTNVLRIKDVKVNDSPAAFELEMAKPVVGSALHISIPRESTIKIEISFETTEECTAIKFMMGDTGPFVFSQCQAIHARSLFPCFDTPAVKSPFKFFAKSPARVTMSGRPIVSKIPDVYSFDQPIPIPSYLVSLTSGNLHKAPIGPRSDIYSEPTNLKQCQWEFEKDMENYIQIAEALVFDYEWERFDALVLPSSFPYGGMEIPNMTQLTPTLVCGDRSQTTVMAHELAHSWSGNLVTNCSWEHFWLNEGWTVYLERRILGAIAAKEARSQGKSEDESRAYGEQARQFDMLSGWNSLVETCDSFDPQYTKLVIDLKGKDPDDSFSRIPYEKGFFFLYLLEKKLGGVEHFDPFIKFYFKKFRYKSLDTADFVETLYEFFSPLGKKDVLDSIDWNKQLFSSGVPDEPVLDTSLADEVYEYGRKWVDFVQKGDFSLIPFSDADTSSFSIEQNIFFLEYLSEKFKSIEVPPELVKKLPSVYPKYARSQNGEFITTWNDILIRNGNYNAEDEVVKRFANWLGHTGRMKYARPGYLLLKNGVSSEFAISQFKKHESFYHPICRAMIEKDLGLA